MGYLPALCFRSAVKRGEVSELFALSKKVFC